MLTFLIIKEMQILQVRFLEANSIKTSMKWAFLYNESSLTQFGGITNIYNFLYSFQDIGIFHIMNMVFIIRQPLQK